MKKIIWQNLLSRAKASEDALHPHVRLLETFMARESILMCDDQGEIGFDLFEEFVKDSGISKAALFNGPLEKTFRALDEELSEQTLSFVVDGHSIIYHFKDKLCTDIYNIEIDLDSYTFASILGSGTNGTARLYKNKNGLEIVVKTPNPAIPHSGYYAARKRDIEIAQSLYPNDGFYCINEHTRSALDDKGKVILDNKGKILPAYGFYAIAPYIPSVNLTEFCHQIKTKAELIETLLAFTHELHRIHTAGVIHGDIHPSNVRLWRDSRTNKVGVRFIDFECAYYRHTENATKTLQQAPHWAPERIDKPTAESAEFAGESFEYPTLKSHPAQDMFSFGYTLWQALYHHSLLKQLSFISKFYHECTQPEQDRPLAERFIYELKRETELEKVASSSSTAGLFRQGIAGKERLINEEHFTVKNEEKSQEETPVDLASQRYSILDRKKPAPAFLTTAKSDHYPIIPLLVDFGIKAGGIIRKMGGYLK
jgi:serine/threonine protein kinase